VTGVTLRLDKRPDRPFDVQRIALSIRRLTALIPFSPIPLEEGVLRAFRDQPDGVRVAVRGS